MGECRGCTAAPRSNLFSWIDDEVAPPAAAAACAAPRACGSSQCASNNQPIAMECRDGEHVSSRRRPQKVPHTASAWAQPAEDQWWRENEVTCLPLCSSSSSCCISRSSQQHTASSSSQQLLRTSVVGLEPGVRLGHRRRIAGIRHAKVLSQQEVAAHARRLACRARLEALQGGVRAQRVPAVGQKWGRGRALMSGDRAEPSCIAPALAPPNTARPPPLRLAAAAPSPHVQQRILHAHVLPHKRLPRRRNLPGLCSAAPGVAADLGALGG